MSYHYRYLDRDDRPLGTCPECSADLRKPERVRVEIVMASVCHDFRTCLDQDGNLLDVDRLVANGYHGETQCGECGEPLTEYEQVEVAHGPAEATRSVCDSPRRIEPGGAVPMGQCPSIELRRYLFELTAFLCFDVEAADKDAARARAQAFADAADEYARLTEVEWPEPVSEVSLAFEDIPELIDGPDDERALSKDRQL
jgi:hypothetical protein